MKTDRERNDLRSAVARAVIDTRRFVDEDERRIEQAWYGRELAFDRAGNLIEQTFRNADGSTFRTLHERGGDGRLLTTRGYDAAGRLAQETDYVYDAAGRLVAERQITPDGAAVEQATYSYDEQGRKTKTQVFESAPGENVFIGIDDLDFGIGASAASSMETRYDERDLAAEVIMGDAAGALVSRVEIKRDEHGDVLTVTRFNGDVSPFGRRLPDVIANAQAEQITPDQRAEMEAELQRLFGPGTPASVQTYAYDDERRRIEATMEMIGIVALRQTFAYDERGDKVEEASYDQNGQRLSRTILAREYDAHGNWIVEVVSTISDADVGSSASTPQHVTRRTITYY